jgi:hypothetical protein
VFARGSDAAAILEALRARRTVVYGLDGRAFGDPALAALAAGHPRLRDAATRDVTPTPLDWTSRALGALGLVGLILFDGRRSAATLAT